MKIELIIEIIMIYYLKKIGKMKLMKLIMIIIFKIYYIICQIIIKKIDNYVKILLKKKYQKINQMKINKNKYFKINYNN